MTVSNFPRNIFLRPLIAAAAAVTMILMLTLTILAGTTGTALAGNVDHDRLVPEVPRRDVPIVLDGDVWKSVQFNDRIIVAGEFQQVETSRGGPVVNRPNIFAYDVNTGEIIDDFNPNLNGPVFDVVVDDTDNSLFLGGTFTQIDGQFRNRLAKLDYFGNLDPTFRPIVSAMVNTLVVGDGELFVGGTFARVNNEPHNQIAAVDTVFGRSVADFNYQIRGAFGRGGSQSVRALDLTEDNRLFVAHVGQEIVDNNGVGHDHVGVAVIDLVANRVEAWNTPWFASVRPRCSQGDGDIRIRDAELSPDESVFVVVEQGGYNCDKILSFDTDGGANTEPNWVSAAFDSVLSVGVTNDTVYVGGHFCFIEALGAIPSSQALNYPFMPSPESCDISNGNDDVDGIPARQQIAALDINTGAALDWNPTSNALFGVLDIEPVERGLLIGQDNDRIGITRTGHHAFLDFGGTTPDFNPTPNPTPGPPGGGECVASVNGTVVSLGWDAVAGQDSYVVRRNNSFVTSVAATSFSEAPGSGSFDYVIRYRVAGEVIDLTCNSVTVGGDNGQPDPTPDLTCSAEVVGGVVTLSWTDNDASTQVVRRDGRWVATVADDATSFTATINGDYVIRLFGGGGSVDVVCEEGAPAPDPIPDGGPFVPEPGVTYRLTAQNGSVLAGDSDGDRDAFALSTAAAGANPGAVAWEFVDAGNGQYHLDLATGGNFSRLSVTNNANEPLFARLTRDRFTGGDKAFAIEETSPGSGTYHITALDNRIDDGNDRLFLTNNDAGFTSPNTTGSSVTFTITPVG